MNAEKAANSGIVLLLLACVTVIAYGLCIYDILNIFGTTAKLFFFLLPSLAILGLGFLIFLPKTQKIHITLALFSCLFTLYFVEAFMYIFSLSPTGRTIDARSYRQVLKEFQEQTHPVSPHLVPLSFLKNPANLKNVFPLSGLADSQIVFCNEIGEWVFFQSDEHGFNNPSHLFRQPVLDIIGIGDSFTQGECVIPKKNIMGLIRQSYPNTLNLGISGNGPLIELATLKEYAARFRPHTVLWFYFEGNDLTDLEREKTHPILAQYLNRHYSQHLFERKEEVQSYLQQYANQQLQSPQINIWHNYFWYLRKHPVFKFLTLQNILGRLGFFPTVKNQAPAVNLDIFRQIMVQARNEVQSWNGRLIFIYLCEKSRFSRFASPSPYREEILSLIEQLHIPVIDTYEIFQNHPNPLTLFQGHYTEQGYQLVADAILEFLTMSPEISASHAHLARP